MGHRCSISTMNYTGLKTARRFLDLQHRGGMHNLNLATGMHEQLDPECNVCIVPDPPDLGRRLQMRKIPPDREPQQRNLLTVVPPSPGFLICTGSRE